MQEFKHGDEVNYNGDKCFYVGRSQRESCHVLEVPNVTDNGALGLKTKRLHDCRIKPWMEPRIQVKFWHRYRMSNGETWYTVARESYGDGSKMLLITLHDSVGYWIDLNGVVFKNEFYPVEELGPITGGDCTGTE